MLNSAQRTLARLAGRTIAQHVASGGWLGASWPQYTCGWLDQPTLDAARVEAERINPDLWADSARNFRAQSAPPEITDVVVLGRAPNGYELKSWLENGRRYTEFWQPCPGGGYVTGRED